MVMKSEYGDLFQLFPVFFFTIFFFVNDLWIYFKNKRNYCQGSIGTLNFTSELRMNGLLAIIPLIPKINPQVLKKINFFQHFPFFSGLVQGKQFPRYTPKNHPRA